MEFPTLDAFEEIDGKHWLYCAADPATRYEVVSMLDCNGDVTDDEDKAYGGVVELAEDCFTVFTFPDKWPTVH